jgi:GT2 family glycosyltransferase
VSAAASIATSPPGRAVASPRVAAIVIGRNEGERLVRCLQSVLACIPHAVYVDSGSRDGSVERARSMGVHVIELKDGPYTAARGRQAGMEFLCREYPDLEYVQFIDGDCVLDPAWLERAVRFLDEHPRAGGAFGRRREVNTAGSFYSRMIDIDWEMPVGTVHCHGGDALDRVSALRQIGGWSTDLIAGEDPDLGFRLNDAGWSIHCLPVEMTRHDIAMSRFAAYWKRSSRSGHAYAEVYWRNRRGSGRRWLRKNVSILFYGLVLPLSVPVLLLIWWPLALVPVLLFLRLVWMLSRDARRRGVRGRVAVQYGLISAVCKTASAMGVLRFILGRLTGNRRSLIEYKGVQGEPG